MSNTIDFEVYDIRNLAVWDKITEVDIRIFGNVNGIDIDYNATCWIPASINTYSELAEHIVGHVLQVELDKKPIEDVGVEL